jgi:hypothetical protein
MQTLVCSLQMTCVVAAEFRETCNSADIDGFPTIKKNKINKSSDMRGGSRISRNLQLC